MTAFRLALDLGEETRARWRAAAERIGYERLDVWAYDTLDAAADPDAGQVVGVETIGDPERVELRGRLTTAETERDEAREGAIYVLSTPLPDGSKTVKLLGDTPAVLAVMEMRENLRAAEARVEALSEALREIDEHGIHGHAPDGKCGPCVARAALACPPQQRGE